jgi:hypothetical protein
MDDQENAFVRVLARSDRTSINDAITSLIRDRMARYPAPPAASDPPRKAPALGFPARPKKRTPPSEPPEVLGGVLRDRKQDGPPEVIPGQTDILDDDQ